MKQKNKNLLILIYFKQNIADELKSMSPSIDDYKTIGLTFISTAQRYIDSDTIQNEINQIGKGFEYSGTFFYTNILFR